MHSDDTPIGHSQGTFNYERLLHLDVLRGFALFGILLVNFEWFNRSAQAMLLGSATNLDGADYWSARLIEWLAESKFFPIFSMLFGMGFALMYNRALAAGRTFFGLYVRRLLALALFGVLHIALVWSGDILFMYAGIACLMLVFFRKTPTRRLYKWAIACWLFPLLLTVASAAFFHSLPPENEVRMEVAAEMEADYRALLLRIESGEYIHQHGSFAENVRQRLHDFRIILTDFGFFWIPMVLGYFLFGRWLIESGIMAQPHEHAHRLKRWQWWGLGFGLPASLVALPMMHEAHFTIPDWPMTGGLALYLAGSIALALAYLAIITRHAHRLLFLAPVGRMALTNYLLQSVFWVTVFYGYGLGLWGRIPHALFIPLSLLFISLQVVFSRWWMRRYRYGPMEWLWRALTRLGRPT